MLDRKSLGDGTFLNAFKDAPGIEWWPDERIETSMQGMLAKRVPGEPVWIFAYGSLIWNPLFRFVESCPATLPGWRRSFCIRLLIGRACQRQPGRMMSLVAGGATDGLALRLDEKTLEQELRIVWRREMVGGAYRPDWAPVTLGDGRIVRAIIFSADPGSVLHEIDDDVETIAPFIASAKGPLGSNRDYVLQLDAALRRHRITDGYIRELAELLSAAR
ncbi:gamma-glutamylcyclotransferase [Castellaniella sp. S9]|uniref:gamma-glutamylcyclotransferase n=1 Tax=Castellaniella sp. S9 TaxID=2993652 RepID=UPI0022B2FCC5|nr:gamma-glutamylcyclotransferase [Castellaniella sp. S9]